VRIEHGKGGRHRGIRLMMIRDDHIHAEFPGDRNLMMRGRPAVGGDKQRNPLFR